MRKIKLYRIETDGREPVFIASRTSNHAAEIYVTVEVAAARALSEFSVERVDDKLPAGQRLGLDDMLAHGVTGIASLDHLFGWVVSSPA
jgi:hypothetical protein